MPVLDVRVWGKVVLENAEGLESNPLNLGPTVPGSRFKV